MINQFRYKYAFLSNFYYHTIKYEGIKYPTVEHAFQSAKTLKHSKKLQISSAKSPRRAKWLGRRVKLRFDWESVKIDIMKEILKIKFSDPKLQKKLLLTGKQFLVEGNDWGDTFWGVCSGKGENHLGVLLMSIREHYYSKQKFKKMEHEWIKNQIT